MIPKNCHRQQEGNDDDRERVGGGILLREELNENERGGKFLTHLSYHVNE